MTLLASRNRIDEHGSLISIYLSTHVVVIAVQSRIRVSTEETIGHYAEWLKIDKKNPKINDMGQTQISSEQQTVYPD